MIDMARKSILVVDDEKNQREILETILSSEGYDVTTASSGEAAMKFVQSRRFDLVLTDLKMTGMSGLDLLKELTNFDKSIIVILLTAHGSVDSAVDALRLGAFDYLQKPYDQAKLLETVSRALNKLSALDTEIVSVSPEMDKVKKLILKIAKSNSTVLIRGESGTGKELIARSIHMNSLRSSNTFQAVNCAAINENLLESELFGHEKGSFTGAVGEKKGLFEIADGGTLFLDEIGELDIALQAKLLRVLQEGEIRAIGATAPRRVNVRIVAATNRNLEKEVAEGRFREDLYYRLKVFPLRVPALRERREDVPLLAAHFLERYTREFGREIAGFTQPALELLAAYDWPGNVRELRNVVQSGYILAADTITAECLPPELRGRAPEPRHAPAAEGVVTVKPGTTIADAERMLIFATLRQFGGDKTRAAESLGISLKTLYNRLHAYEKEDHPDGDAEEEEERGPALT